MVYGREKSSAQDTADAAPTAQETARAGLSLSKEIPRARLLIQPHVSHFAMLQNPEQFNQAVLEFLGRE